MRRVFIYSVIIFIGATLLAPFSFAQTRIPTTVYISPGVLYMNVGDSVGLSSFVTDQNGVKITSGPTYDWGISSGTTVGTYTSTNENLATFKALAEGAGDLFLTVTYNGVSVTKGVHVVVGTIFPNATPSFNIFDLKSLLLKYNQVDDSPYFPIDGKINTLDAGYVMSYL